MKTSKGSIIGLWKYQPGAVFETDDIVLGKTLSDNYILGVIINADNGVSSTAETIDGLITLGVLGPYNNEQYPSLAEIISTINSLLKFYNVDDLNVISGSVWSITVPGLYKVIPASTNLPASYSSITLITGYVRVTTQGSYTYYELIDFGNNRYFVARSDNHTWVELTGNGITAATALIEEYYTTFVAAIADLNDKIDEFDERLRFMQDEYIDWSRSSVILFTEDPPADAYIVNLHHDEFNSNNELLFTRTYSIRVAASDAAGTVYDEYGTTKTISSGVTILTLGTGVICTSGYRIV